MIDDQDAGTFEIPVSRNPGRGGVDIGRDVLSPITDRYDPPFEFTGIIHSVDVTVEPTR